MVSPNSVSPGPHGLAVPVARDPPRLEPSPRKALLERAFVVSLRECHFFNVETSWLKNRALTLPVFNYATKSITVPISARLGVTRGQKVQGPSPVAWMERSGIQVAAATGGFLACLQDCSRIPLRYIRAPDQAASSRIGSTAPRSTVWRATHKS